MNSTNGNGYSVDKKAIKQKFEHNDERFKQIELNCSEHRNKIDEKFIDFEMRMKELEEAAERRNNRLYDVIDKFRKDSNGKDERLIEAVSKLNGKFEGSSKFIDLRTVAISIATSFLTAIGAISLKNLLPSVFQRIAEMLFGR